MSDADRLLAAFDSGELLRPTPGTPNLVDLTRAIALLCGAEDAERTPAAEAIADRIGVAQHLIFVLADGLGMNLLQSMPRGAFLRRRLAMELCTVFPSTTAVVLTTLATGEWPAQHGITGWWTYVREVDGAVTVVRFERRSDARHLNELGVRTEQLLPLPSWLSRMDRDALSLLPRAIVDSSYSRYAAGGTRREGYGSLRAAVDAVVEHVLEADSPTYTYLYVPRIDSAAHEHGSHNRYVTAELAALDQQLERLAERLAGQRARIVLSADHGHLDAPMAKRHLINGGEDLAATFRVAPSYDSRVMCFHLRDGAEQAFRAAIERQLGDIVFVLSVNEVEELELLGPGGLSRLTRERLGDFVAIARGADAIGYRPAMGGREIMGKASHHSGLAPDEMRIPLLIA